MEEAGAEMPMLEVHYHKYKSKITKCGEGGEIHKKKNFYKFKCPLNSKFLLEVILHWLTDQTFRAKSNVTEPKYFYQKTNFQSNNKRVLQFSLAHYCAPLWFSGQFLKLFCQPDNSIKPWVLI